MVSAAESPKPLQFSGTQEQLDDLYEMVKKEKTTIELTFAEMVTVRRALDLAIEDLAKSTFKLLRETMVVDRDKDPEQATGLAEAAAFARETLLISSNLRKRLNTICMDKVKEREARGVPIHQIVEESTVARDIMFKTGMIDSKEVVQG